MSEAGVYAYETQRTEISSLLNSPLQKGDTWYVVHEEFSEISECPVLEWVLLRFRGAPAQVSLTAHTGVQWK